MSTSDPYVELRPRAFAVAYRMLGSVSEAEDLVQEAFLRLHQTLQRDLHRDSPCHIRRVRRLTSMGRVRL
jgi:DNA-directed RNA polymerase specialized sigma24 family protein